MKKRSDNRGFTLVEIVIAVAILAIAVSPLVANFIQSSKLNLKGRKSLNAMNLAQDIMEGMSGFTAEEVAGLIDGTIADSSKTLVGSILPSSATYSTVAKSSPAGDEKLVYSLNGVKAVSGSKSAYNVKVTLDPTGADQAEFNGKDVANISEVNQYYDAIFTYDPAEVGTAIRKMHSDSNFTQPEDSFRGNVLRTIHIKAENIGTATAPEYKVSVTRAYSLTPTFAASVGLTGYVHNITTDNIIKGDEKQLPRSIYLYYEGIAGSTQLNRQDTIEVESVLGEKITVYLIRQMGSAYDDNYGCDVKITSTDASGAYTEDIHIVSNLRYDLDQAIMAANFRNVHEDGTPIPETEIEYPLNEEGLKKKLEDINVDDDYIKSSSYDRGRAQYYYNSDINLINDTLYDSNFTAGYAKKEKNTLYKVLIEVYDTSSGERIAHYNGGLSN